MIQTPNIRDIQETVADHAKWISDHQKKSTRHSIYFGLVVTYVVYDIICRIL